MTMTHKTLQARGYCTAAGYDRVREILAMSATLYNAALQERRDAWKMTRRQISMYDQMQQLTLVRQDDPDWAALDTVLARGALVRIDRAFRAFFRRVRNGGKPGFPRFKSRYRYSTLELSEVRPSMIKTSPSGKTFLKIRGLPNIRIKPSRELPAEGLKAVRITLRNRCLTVNLTYQVEIAQLAPSNKAVGIDFGVNQRLTASDGTIIPGIQRDRRQVTRLQRGRCQGQEEQQQPQEEDLTTGQRPPQGPYPQPQPLPQADHRDRLELRTYRRGSPPDSKHGQVCQRHPGRTGDKCGRQERPQPEHQRPDLGTDTSTTALQGRMGRQGVR